VEARYVITGANGFLGAALARELVHRGHEVVLVLHRREDHPFLSDLDAEHVRADVTDRNTLEGVLRSGDMVLHCAAFVSFSSRDADEVMRVNVEGTRTLLDLFAERGAARVLVLSAGAVWGTTTSPDDVITEARPSTATPGNAYAASKVAVEAVCREAAAKGLQVVMANPGTVYGAGDVHLRAGGRVVQQVARRGVAVLPPGGTTWLSVEDGVAGMLLALRNGTPGERYILATATVTHAELMCSIATALGMSTRGVVLPFLLRPFVAAAAGLVGLEPTLVDESFRFKYLSSERARRELGFEPRADLDESLRATVRFLQRQGVL